MIGILANCIIVDILAHHRMVGNTHEVSRQITDHELKIGDSVTDGAEEAEEGTMALRSLSQTCPQLVNLGDDGSDGDDHDVDEDERYYGSGGGGVDDYGLRHFFIFFASRTYIFL